MRCRGKSANISSLLYRQYAHSVFKSLSKWMRCLDRNAVNRGRRLGSSRQGGSTACRALGKWQTSSSRTTSICLFMYAKVTQWDGTCSLLDGLVWCGGVRGLLLTSCTHRWSRQNWWKKSSGAWSAALRRTSLSSTALTSAPRKWAVDFLLGMVNGGYWEMKRWDHYLNRNSCVLKMVNISDWLHLF